MNDKNKPEKTFEKVNSKIINIRKGKSHSKQKDLHSTSKLKSSNMKTKEASVDVHKNNFSGQQPQRLGVNIQQIQIFNVSNNIPKSSSISDNNVIDSKLDTNENIYDNASSINVNNIKQSEKEIFSELIKFAKKGDRVGFINSISKFLSIKGNLNMKDSVSWSILHHAVNEGNLKIVDILLKTKINLDNVNNNKQTPLHIAIQQGFFDITKKLIEKGAAINCLDNEKNNIIHYCCLNNHIELLKYLIEKSPPYLINEKNMYSKTPKDLAKDPLIISLFNDIQKAANNNNSASKPQKFERIKIHDTTKEIDFSKKLMKKGKDSKNNNITSFSNNNRNSINISISTNMKNINNHPITSQTNSKKKMKIKEKSPQLHQGNVELISKKSKLNYKNEEASSLPQSHTPSIGPDINMNQNTLEGDFRLISGQNSQILTSNNKNKNNIITSAISSKNIKSNTSKNNNIIGKNTSSEHNSQNFNFHGKISELTKINQGSTTPHSKFTTDNLKNTSSTKVSNSTRKSETENKLSNTIKSNKEDVLGINKLKVPITSINLNNVNKDPDGLDKTKSLAISNNKSTDYTDYENISTKKFKIGGSTSKQNLSTSSSSKLKINNTSKSNLHHNSKKEFINNKLNLYNNLIHKEINLYTNNNRPETTKKSSTEFYSNKFQIYNNNPNSVSTKTTQSNNNSNIQNEYSITLEKNEKPKHLASHKTFETPQKVSSKSKLESLKEKLNHQQSDKKFNNCLNNKMSEKNNKANKVLNSQNTYITSKNENTCSFKLNLINKKDIDTQNKSDHKKDNNIYYNITKSKLKSDNNGISQITAKQVFENIQIEPLNSTKKLKTSKSKNLGQVSSAQVSNSKLKIAKKESMRKNEKLNTQTQRTSNDHSNNEFIITNEVKSTENKDETNRKLSNAIQRPQLNLNNVNMHNIDEKNENINNLENENTNNQSHKKKNKLNPTEKPSTKKNKHRKKEKEEEKEKETLIKIKESEEKVLNEKPEEDKTVIEKSIDPSDESKEKEKEAKNEKVDLDISNKQIITDSDGDEESEDEEEEDDENDSENVQNISNFNHTSNTFNTNNNSNIGNDTSSIEEKVLPTSFICHALLGKGSFGEVYLVEKINTKTLYAMKVLSKDRIMGKKLLILIFRSKSGKICYDRKKCTINYKSSIYCQT